MTRIPFDEMKATIKMAFTLAGMPDDKAEICARTHTESSMDGIYSHGHPKKRRPPGVGHGHVSIFLRKIGGTRPVFIAIDPLKINTQEMIDEALNSTINQLRSSVPVTENGEILYPGERSLTAREENRTLGIPVDDRVWNKVKVLAGLIC
ncbi:MAG: Ldh family oxidoreductase [Bacteroidetes bacterium]|nr:Ldh family oxidoreductase [Bacteroidota bacterium]